VPIALEEITAALADRFLIEREVGAGGWAIVYLAEDLKLGRPVAIKVLRPELATQEGELRFEREIEVAASLRHPHILPLLDSGVASGFPFYVMPFVEGESLREKLDRGGPLPIAEATRLAREIADALAYAHRRGVVHRDIKPGNVMIDSGHAVVTDFGIAALTQALAVERLTSTGEMPGTPHYMAPEQLGDGTEIDGRADIYSLGCVLYEMLAGDRPITGSSAYIVLARKLAGEIPRLRVVRESVPERLEEIVERALARVPADRFRDAAELEAALGALGPDHAPAPPARSIRRRTLAERIALTVGASVVGLVFTIGIGFLATTAFDLKLQVPEAFTPTRSDHFVVGFRALLPVLVLALVSTVAFHAARFFVRRVGATLTRVPALRGPKRAIDEYVLTAAQRLLASARPGTVADAFFLGMIVVSLVALSYFGDLLSVLWSTETAILACEHKPLHRSFLIVMVVLVTAFGGAWLAIFRRLAPRGPTRAGVAFSRWGSLAWIVGLIVVSTLPWRIMNADAERLRVDGEPGYLLGETPSELLVFTPDTGFADARDRAAAGGIVRLGIRGHPFEGAAAFDSGLPWCESFSSPGTSRRTGEGSP